MRRLFRRLGLHRIYGDLAAAILTAGPAPKPEKKVERPLFRQVLCRSSRKGPDGKWRPVRDWNRWPYPDPTTDYA